MKREEKKKGKGRDGGGVEAEEGERKKDGEWNDGFWAEEGKREPDSLWNYQPRDLRFRRFLLFSIFLRIGQLKK